MRKLTQKWNSLSRKKKILFFLISMILLIPLVYLLSGCPSLTPEMAMHRLEQTSMVGPSEIISTEEINLYGMKHMLIGKTSNGYTLYGYGKSDNSIYYESLVYRAKKEPVTVMALTALPHDSCRALDEKLPIVLFANDPKAIRAELEISLSHPYYQNYACDYSLSATQNPSGYFFFEIPFDQRQFELDSEGRLITHMSGEAYEKNELLRDIGHTLGGNKSGFETIPITVRLYNKDGKLLLSQTVPIHPYDKP